MEINQDHPNEKRGYLSRASAARSQPPSLGSGGNSKGSREALSWGEKGRRLWYEEARGRLRRILCHWFREWVWLSLAGAEMESGKNQGRWLSLMKFSGSIATEALV